MLHITEEEQQITKENMERLMKENLNLDIAWLALKMILKLLIGISKIIAIKDLKDQVEIKMEVSYAEEAWHNVSNVANRLRLK